MTTTVSTENTTKLDDSNSENTEHIKGKNQVSSNSAKFTQAIAKSITSLPNVSPDWTYRRKLVFTSMYFIGGCLSVIIIASVFVLIHNTLTPGHGQIDMTIANLIDSITYVLGFIAFSIIGTYCFGAAWEHMSYRSNMFQMAAKIATAGNDTPQDNTTAVPTNTNNPQ